MKLYTAARSSAAYRVRVALEWKGLGWEPVFVNLRTGEQHQADYQALNPQGLIPALVHDDRVLTQSLAILEYLEELQPEPALLPSDPAGRARVRQLALVVACEVHPRQNMGTLALLRDEFGFDDDATRRWYLQIVGRGLRALEALLANDSATGRFCHGDQPTLADACLVPQLFNLRRHDAPIDDYPNAVRIEQACLQLDAFHRARPESQPDF